MTLHAARPPRLWGQVAGGRRMARRMGDIYLTGPILAQIPAERKFDHRRTSRLQRPRSGRVVSWHNGGATWRLFGSGAVKCFCAKLCGMRS